MLDAGDTHLTAAVSDLSGEVLLRRQIALSPAQSVDERRDTIVAHLRATLAEAGVKDFETAPWQGLLGPANLPAPIVNYLQIQIAALLKLPEMKEKLAATGTDAVGNTPQEFAVAIAGDAQRLGRVIKAAGIRAE